MFKFDVLGLNSDMEISNNEIKTIYNTDKVVSGKEWLGKPKMVMLSTQS